jgi:hypothetical protein
VVKALDKPEGRGFETRCGGLIFFTLPTPSGSTRLWGLLSLTEISFRGKKIMSLGSRARPARRAETLPPSVNRCLNNV